MIKLIVGVSINSVFGNSQTNTLPWANHYPEDLKFFRKMTSGSTVIMGRKTYESIGKPLKNRYNIVISKHSSFSEENLSCASSLNEAISQSQTEDVWLIGGESIYREGLRYAQELYLTVIPEVISGPNLIYFPWINPLEFQVHETIDLGEELKVIRYNKK